MCAPRPPTPPDPHETAAAQTGTNIGTAVANNAMGMVNQVTPDGSLTYSQNGTYSWTDPYTHQTYNLPQYTATTAFSANGQAIADQNGQTRLNLAQIGNQQSSFLQDYLSHPFNGDTSAIEGRLSELGRQRLDPQFAQERGALESQLANQGITPGSAAYDHAMQQFGQTKNDAYNSLYLNGRGQAFGELQALRNQPINEIMALLSGSQVSQPNVSVAQPQGAATTDVAGLINNNYNQRYQNYANAVNQQNGVLGGLFGLGGTILGAPAGSLAAAFGR